MFNLPQEAAGGDGNKEGICAANIRLYTTLPSSSNTLLDPRNFHFLGVGTRT